MLSVFVVKNSVTPTTVLYLYVDQDKLQLDHKHDYFYQIQGQLLCSQRKKGYLVVYTMVDIKILETQRDDHFINAMILKLDTFFQNYFRVAFLLVTSTKTIMVTIMRPCWLQFTFLTVHIIKVFN